MNKESSQIKESIIRILNGDSNGLGVSEISKRINVYRATVSKYLVALEHQGIVSSKMLGTSKLYFLNEKKVEQISSAYEENDWIDDFIEEIKEELKKEILGS